MTVSGAGSSWTNAGTIVVGGLGTGTLTIQNGGTVKTSEQWRRLHRIVCRLDGHGDSDRPGLQLDQRTTSGGLNIGSFGTGTLTIANGGRVIDITPLVTNIGNGAGSHGTVTVTGAGSLWSDIAGFRIGNSGTGTLTIADGGIVIAPTVVIAANAGAIGTLNIGAGAGNPAAAPGTLTAPSVAFGAGTGTINFNHTSADYVFAPAISGNGTVNVLAGTTIFTGANSYSGATNVNAGTLRAGAPNTFSPNSAVTVAGGGTLDLNGFNQTVPSVTNAGLVNMGTGTAPGTVLTTTSYTGTGGTMAINTLLGGDGSPSDRLVINGGAATGATTVHVTNVGGPGAETTGNGILVVSAINGATTAPGAFVLPAGELRAGAFDYDLFRGGVSGSPNDWFLRSDFVARRARSTPAAPVTVRRSRRRRAARADVPRCHPPRRRTRCRPASISDHRARTRHLWGGAASGAAIGAQHPRHARRPGRRHLRAGWLRRCACGRAGSPADQKPGPTPAPCPLFSPSVWGRFFGQTIDNHYQAFADPAPAAIWEASRAASIFCADR